MKKNGFTLAEVLITLTIIGVVAVLTLPALNANVQEQQARTGLKKAVNVLTNAAAVGSTTVGYNYSGVNAASGADGSLQHLFEETLNIDPANSPTDYTTTAKVATILGGEMALTDGTILFFPQETPQSDWMTTQADGRIKGIPVIIDINGAKAPNKISHCNGSTDTDITELNGDEGTSTSVDGKTSTKVNLNCGNKANRHFHDRYMLLLRGDTVMPLGAASTYLLTNEANISAYNQYAGKTSAN